MAITLGTALARLRANTYLNKATESVASSVSILSSGSRVSKFSDDPGGSSLSANLRASARIYTQGVRNANNSISALNVAQGGLEEFSDILARLKEIAEEASSSTLTSAQRSALDEEGLALSAEVNRIVNSTSFGQFSLFDTSFAGITTQLGIGASNTAGSNFTAEISRAAGSGTFGSASAPLGAGGYGAGATTGDFNGDGRLDVVAADGFVNGVKFARGNGNGTFTAPTLLLGITLPGTLLSTDLNNDGYDDVIAGDGTRLRFFLGSASGLTTHESGNVNTAVSSFSFLRAVDFDGDGDMDIIGANTGGSSIAKLTNNGGLSFGLSYLGNGANVSDLELGDVNGDGNTDIVTTASTGATGRVFLGSSTGAFTLSGTFSAANGLKVDVGDINRDGLDDIVGSDGAIRTSNGDLTFDTGTYAIGTVGVSTNLELADIDGDGLLDIYRSVSQGEISYGNPDGAFQAFQTAGFSNVTNVIVSDFDNDGINDLFHSSSATNQVRLGLATSTAEIKYFDLRSATSAAAVSSELDSLIDQVDKQLGKVSAALSQLESAASVTDQIAQNVEIADDRIRDPDTAFETARLVKQSSIRESAAFVAAQGDLDRTVVLSLLDLKDDGEN